MDKHPGYNDIVPTEVQDELIQWGDDIDSNCWRIGERANELAAEWKGKLSLFQTCEACAYFAKIPGATVRDYERLFRCTPKEIRQEYAELAMSHFRLVIPYAKELVEWRAILDKWIAEAKTLSVSSLAQFLDQNHDQGTGYHRTLLYVKDRVMKIAESKQATRVLKVACYAFLKVLRQELSQPPKSSNAGPQP